MTQEINRKLHEALGKCWHEDACDGKCSCGSQFLLLLSLNGHIKESNPDYCGDPRLVIEVMREREDWFEFLAYIEKYNHWSVYMVDHSGLLALLTAEWIKEKGK